MTNDRIIFVDIDGVLLPFGGDNPTNLDTFSDEAVAVLAAFKRDGWKLVLHSTWRHADDDYIAAFERCKNRGIPLDGCVDRDEPSKANAIDGWIIDNCFPWDRFPTCVAIDDDDLPANNWWQHISPDFRYGLRWQDVEGLVQP